MKYTNQDLYAGSTNSFEINKNVYAPALYTVALAAVFGLSQSFSTTTDSLNSVSDTSTSKTISLVDYESKSIISEITNAYKTKSLEDAVLYTIQTMRILANAKKTYIIDAVLRSIELNKLHLNILVSLVISTSSLKNKLPSRKVFVDDFANYVNANYDPNEANLILIGLR